MGYLDSIKQKLLEFLEQDHPKHSPEILDQEMGEIELQEPGAFGGAPAPDFLGDQQRRYDEDQRMLESTPLLKVRDKRVQDVLEVLNIPETFSLERDVLFPEDVKNVSFSLQAPYGYEQGEVNAFVNRCRITVERYVELLVQRNEHVAQLATAMDRLQVDNENLRLQQQIDSGINIIASGDANDLESELMEATLVNRRLEDQIKRLERELKAVKSAAAAAPNTSQLEEHQAALKRLRDKAQQAEDQASLLRRDKERLEGELYHLKNRATYLEEMADEGGSTPPAAPQQPSLESALENPPGTAGPKRSGLPSLNVKRNESITLPDLDAEVIKNKPLTGAPTASSAFAIVEEDTQETSKAPMTLSQAFEAGPETLSNPAQELFRSRPDIQGEEDGDDAIDQLMKEWNQ